MAEMLPMLALSPTMEQGVLVKWNKSEGDQIASGDVVCEVETDKAVMEYEASVEGTMLKQLIAEGDSVAVGQPIAILGEEGEDIADLVKEAQKQLAEAPAPKANEGEAEESAGAEEAKGEDEAAPAAKPQAAESQAGAESQGAKPQAVAKPPAAPVPQAEGIKASPLARKLATEAGLDLRQVSGTGPGGRIVQRDIESAISAGVGLTSPAMQRVQGAAVTPAPALADKSIKVSPMRKTIAKRLSESKFSAPHFYLSVDVAMDDLLATRKQINAELGGKLSLNAFLIKLAAAAVARHPQINSTWAGDTIERHGSVDVGLAVALDDGLITPVVRDCANKGVVAIDRELAELIGKARSGKLSQNEYTGATFTISNLGTFGIDSFTAIINPPGSAILAIGQVVRKPVVDDNEELIVAGMMNMTLSCDHRVIDGALGAAFMNELKQMMQTPLRALL